MMRRLQKHGNSVALVIDRTMLDALHMTADTPVHITLHGNSLVITPVNSAIGEKVVSETIDRLRPRYRNMLRNLAK